jgi:hypothetical protein
MDANAVRSIVLAVLTMIIIGMMIRFNDKLNEILKKLK